MDNEMDNRKKIQAFAKRQIDFWFALFGFIVTAPLTLIIAVAIRFNSKGPVFFTQQRPGKDGKMFSIVKFRTMEQGAEQFGLDMSDDNPRITAVGRFLRRYHLDELPQLINIIKGEMSFVGPRPPLLSQVDMNSDFEKKRFLVKPGLAGWAQLHQGNWISWQERVAYDVWYAEHWSLLLDAKIFLLSFWKLIVRGEGLYLKK